jgi:hypothetical protein
MPFEENFQKRMKITCERLNNHKLLLCQKSCLKTKRREY